MPRRIGLEGAGGYGVGLARRLIDAGEDAREVPTILTRRERHHTGRPGKCDSTDALAIACVVARGERLPVAMASAMYRDLKVLVDYRQQLLAEQARVRNRLHADLQALLPGYAERVGRLTLQSQLKAARRMLRPLDGVAAEIGLRRLARLEAITNEANQVKHRITASVGGSHRALTSITGVGPVLAAQLLAETGDPRRFHSPAAFAMNWGCADPGFLRRYPPSSPQSPRQSSPQPRSLHRRAHPGALPPACPSLHRAQASRGAQLERGGPLSQASPGGHRLPRHVARSGGDVLTT